ncbi:MAG: hypothetical protein H7257_02615 [Taibaiella sp.]|nr:hypothetical protein [Taibaiella sp.]
MFSKLVSAVFFTGVLVSLACGSVRAQSFHKGAVLVSLSEGTTHSIYSTHKGNCRNDGRSSVHVQGDRDPLSIEYGLSSHWGIGINLGTDIFKVVPGFYQFSVPGSVVKAYMAEATFDVNYHFFNTKHTDLSAFFSIGCSSVILKGDDRDYGDMYLPVNITESKENRHYSYNAGGGIMRMGAKGKYYFRRRFGVMGIISLYAAGTSPNGVKDNNVGINTTTAIRGWAIEFGPCFRFF